MSVFQVQLQNPAQGQMDRDFSSATWAMIANGATPGVPFTTSQQRQVVIVGPNKNMMLLKDGATFTGPNYFKRYCYPQVGFEDAVLVCTTDDGTIWNDFDPEANTAVAGTSVDVTSGAVFTDTGMTVDVVSSFGSPATFCQITVGASTTATDSVDVEINGNTAAVLTLVQGTVQIFNTHDLVIRKLRFKDTTGLNVKTVPVQLTFGVKQAAQASNVTKTVFPLGPAGLLA